jgi:hypothetical protein
MVLYFFLLDRRVLIGVFDALAFILAIVSISALIVFIFSILGITLPSFYLEQDFRNNPADFYMVYPGSIVLSSQVWELGFGSFIRTSGIVREPGHFAILCALVLLGTNSPFEKKRYLWVFIGGLLTFSPVFYIYIILFFLISKTDFQKIVWFSFSFSFLLLIIYFGLIPDYVLNRVFFNYIDAYSSGGISGLFSSRADVQFSSFYSELSISDKFVGLGSKATEMLGYGSSLSSDYRAFIVTRGVLGLFCILLFYYSILYSIRNKRQLWLLIGFIALVFMHRSSFIVEFWFIALVVCIVKRSNSALYKNYIVKKEEQ